LFNILQREHAQLCLDFELKDEDDTTECRRAVDVALRFNTSQAYGRQYIMDKPLDLMSPGSHVQKYSQSDYLL
jgi:hypothetical protein